MRKKGQLSIIVPMYNGEKRIRKCIESIFAQSYEDIELIVIDDGSKDASYETVSTMLQQQASEHVQARVLRQENHGVAYTRNYGISLASGEYIAFIDQDDYILPDYCTAYMEEAKKTDADIVVGGFARITDEGEITRQVSLKQELWSKFVVTAPWAHIYKTTFIQENQVQFLSTGLGEDIYFNLVAYAYTEKVSVISNSSYMWVNNPTSVSNSKQNSINAECNPLYLLNALKDRIPKENKLGAEYEEYFFMRYIVWYFSFTLRASRKKDVAEMYEQLMQWLKAQYPTYRKNPNISIRKPVGDEFFIRMAVWLFYRLERMGMLPGALKLLAKK